MLTLIMTFLMVYTDLTPFSVLDLNTLYGISTMSAYIVIIGIIEILCYRSIKPRLIMMLLTKSLSEK